MVVTGEERTEEKRRERREEGEEGTEQRERGSDKLKTKQIMT